MKALIIKDLARTEELERSAMAAVRGGTAMRSMSYGFPLIYSPSSDSSVHANQDLQQFQSVMNATANGSAFLDGVHVTNKTKQFGQNNVFVD